MEIYVNAKSKKALNDRLASGETVYGTWRLAKRMVVCLALMLLTSGAYAQSVRRDASGNFVAVSSAKARVKPKKTTNTYTDSKGKRWDVYVTDKGRYFVIKTSAKTGKEYRYYLKTEN